MASSANSRPRSGRDRLALMTVAFAAETAIDSGNGHRFLVSHVVQLVGSVLIMLRHRVRRGRRREEI